jgi:tetratricopeptide (TPR) repeat protein
MGDRAKAMQLYEEATSLLLDGDLDDAIELFDLSLTEEPTAEAYTFRGWAKSLKEEVEEAIADCRRAIDTDPTFGNPYNDIGCYLMQLGRHDEAIPWLERAKTAPRYEPRQYPYLNLGRIYEARGFLVEALREFEQALAIRPDDESAQVAVGRLRHAIN